MVYLMETWANWDAVHVRNVAGYDSEPEAQAEADRRNNAASQFKNSHFYVGDGTNRLESLGPATRTAYGD
jgi:hypothetical protein